jgi:hypothetical protein
VWELPDICGSSVLSPKLALRAFFIKMVTKYHRGGKNYSGRLRGNEKNKMDFYLCRELVGIK